MNSSFRRGRRRRTEAPRLTFDLPMRDSNVTPVGARRSTTTTSVAYVGAAAISIANRRKRDRMERERGRDACNAFRIPFHDSIVRDVIRRRLCESLSVWKRLVPKSLRLEDTRRRHLPQFCTYTG